MGHARMPTNAVSFAQAHCMALLEGKLKELQALRRSLQPASPYAHATPHHHQPPVIHPQDHNTFTRNDAGPGLSSAGAAPAPLATRCPKAQPHHASDSHRLLSRSCAGGEATGTTQAAEGAPPAKKAKKAPAKKAAAAGPVTITLPKVP